MKDLTKSKPIVDYIFESFLRPGSTLKGSKPGFNHALKLSYQTMDPDRTFFGASERDEPFLAYRYELSIDIPKHSVGLWTALMDELTTHAIFGASMPGQPGLSLQMQTELVNKQKALECFQNPSTDNPVDIVNYVSKLGKTVTHTRTDFRCAKTQNLLAFSSHVKYMPTGNALFDQVLTNRTLYDLYLKYALSDYQMPLFKEKPMDEVIDANRNYVDENSSQDAPPTTSTYQHCATFTVTDDHTNPFGVMHGGCQAMLMEQVGIHFAREQLKSPSVVLEAMQNEYLSGVPKGKVEVYCEKIGEQSLPENNIHVRVQIRLPKKNGRVCTEGKLRLSSFEPKT